ncbi:TPA: type II toxin-antitoxin system RelE/ParE family toxin [Serratia marcescens]
MRRKVTVRPKALAIWKRSIFTDWRTLAYRWPKIICATCIRLSITLATPQLGRNIDAIGPGLGVLPVANHLIYFRQHRREVNIIRVLHHSRDPLSRSFFS